MRPMFPNYLIKRHAKIVFARNLIRAMGASIVPALIVIAATALIIFITPGAVESLELIVRGSFESHEARMEYAITVMDNYMTAVSAVGVLFAFVNVGMMRMMLDMVRGKKVKMKVLFSYYNKWYIALLFPAAGFLYTVAAGALLKAAPQLAEAIAIVLDTAMLIVSYKLIFLDFALAENGCTSFLGAVRSAWSLTRRQTMVNALVLQLSFIGWFLLAALSGGILLLFVMPYYYLSLATLFDANLRSVQNDEEHET